jgi:hypothetical protein
VVMKSIIFWDITACSPLSVNRLGLPPALTLVSSSAYSSTFNMEQICPSETSVDVQRTTRCCIPEDSTLQVSCSSFVRFHLLCVLLSYFILSLPRNFMSFWRATYFSCNMTWKIAVGTSHDRDGRKRNAEENPN